MGRVPAVREPAPRAATTYAVVANANVPVSELTLDDLRSVFFFRKRFWSGGKRVVLLLPAERSEARGYLLEGIYRMNDAALKRLILEKLFQGEIDMAPRVVETNQEALALVASTRGLVTLVRADAITAGQAGVKVLKINGKLPGEAGYPLMQ